MTTQIVFPKFSPLVNIPTKFSPVDPTLPPAYDSIKELGVYDDLPSDVKAQIGKLAQGIPLAAQAKAQAAMAAEASKPETVDKLMSEVRLLGDSVARVDDEFERVRVGLGKVDQNSYKDKNGNPIAKFQPSWVEYQKVRFTAEYRCAILTVTFRNGHSSSGGLVTLLLPLKPISEVNSNCFLLHLLLLLNDMKIDFLLIAPDVDTLEPDELPDAKADLSNLIKVSYTSLRNTFL